LYGTMWQYQAWARSPDVPSGTIPGAIEPFLSELSPEVLGSFDAPFAVSAVEIVKLPGGAEPYLEELLPPTLGFFERAVDRADLYQSWSQPGFVVLPPLTAPIDERWLFFIPRDERAFDQPWNVQHPKADGLLPAEVLGFFDRPLHDGAVVVYQSWSQPESVPLAMLAAPIDERWLFFIPRDERTFDQPWNVQHPIAEDILPAEILGSFDRPRLAGAVGGGPAIPLFMHTYKQRRVA